jgi:guanylate kinase
MNKILTDKVVYRGREIHVSELKENSNIKVIIECEHGRREVRWNRRNQLCRQCCAKKGLYSTSKIGRHVTWGDKISAAKKGKKLSEGHKKVLVEARKKKVCERLGVKLEEFPGFPTKNEQMRLRLFVMSALKKKLINKTVDEQDVLIKDSLGYSIDDLKSHLESQFTEGMSWDNYGEWHIDHIRPESWFNYSSIEDGDFKKCWSLDNLQPMWADENLKKNNLYEGKYRKPFFYMLCGQSGAGKTTIANKLKHKFTVVHYDSIKVKELDSIIRNNWHNDKPILIDIPIRISTNIKRYQDRYDITPVFILEDVDVIKSRIIGRGGNRTDGVERRYKRMKSLSQRYGKFTGTADEVFTFLNNLRV